jgi:hypothetical protein
MQESHVYFKTEKKIQQRKREKKKNINMNQNPKCKRNKLFYTLLGGE